MNNREIFVKDPLTNELVNKGVVELADPRSDQELSTLRQELGTFVCEGQYAEGLHRILDSYLGNIDREEQAAVWVSGFYGSGKSHLVKMLRFLWTDFAFPDGATSRGIVQLPDDIRAQLKNLNTEGKRHGGLHAAGGKLSAGSGESVRLALLGLVFRSAGLPEDYSAARFVLFLKRNGFLDGVQQAIAREGRRFESELNDLFVSPVLAQALLLVDPNFAESERAVRAQIKAQFPRVTDVSDEDMTTAMEDALSNGGRLPCTLIALDEVQQFIGESSDRALRVQEVAEACVKRFGARVLLVGTGQTAITGTPQLQKLQARFTVPVELSDQDVDTVIRKIVLAKKPDKEKEIGRILAASSGEISRHLGQTKLASRPEDSGTLVADYPLLPVRRRFWEAAMRAVDPTGTKAELRNQLTMVFEAVRATAERPLGSVVPADFLYDQNKTQMVQTGGLLREIQEAIERLNDGTDTGGLKSRICALTFLIGKLPREAAADTGVRAAPEMLADLLVEDLVEGSAELRRRIPPIVAELAEAGILNDVGDGYVMQTTVGAEWLHEYNLRLSRIQNDDAALASERAEVLRERVGEALKGTKIIHGQSKVQRRLELHFSQDAPPAKGPDIPIWVRDGWNDEERSVLTDARAAGTESPLVTVYLPRRSADDLKKHTATARAARETLNAKGHPSTAEGIEARSGMESRQRLADQLRDTLIEDVLKDARVILAGGSEKTGESLAEKVREAAVDVLARLYPRFSDADDSRWGKVVERARAGAANALEAVGYTGIPKDHPVAKELLGFVAGGKKGREIRKCFSEPRFGWPQDAIDGALIVLVGSGDLRAAQDGKTLTQAQMDQRNIGVTDFRLESTPPPPVQELLALRGLFRDAGVIAEPNGEGVAAGIFLRAMKDLATRAGGEPPLPPQPNPPRIAELAALSGNEQLRALCDAREGLSAWRSKWSTSADLIGKRVARWRALETLLTHARSLAVAADLAPQVEAVRTNRALLNDPDPVAPLIGSLIQELRKALQDTRGAYEKSYRELKGQLEDSDLWKRLSQDQQAGILNRYGIAGVPGLQVGAEQELLASLGEISLQEWGTRKDALPQRFLQAMEEAIKLLEPRAVRVRLPSVTIRTQEDLHAWLGQVEAQLKDQLGKGPVII